MKISDAPLAVLRLHYQLARFPLQLIEDRVVTESQRKRVRGCSMSAFARDA